MTKQMEKIIIEEFVRVEWGSANTWSSGDLVAELRVASNVESVVDSDVESVTEVVVVSVLVIDSFEVGILVVLSRATVDSGGLIDVELPDCSKGSTGNVKTPKLMGIRSRIPNRINAICFQRRE
ncbi:hypothetical protein [Anaerosporobacter faecicola]|uniref:hypothetical protein n=1 Tax=Anaerosporobacter faecicola TaxID=2718714 RepID=UPI00143A30EE|nr:hypothetical protein [Anaerosporobacter faecicola]